MHISLDRKKIKVMLLEGVHHSAVEMFEACGYTNIEYLSSSLTESELIERIRDVHILGIRSRTQLSEKVFEAAEKLIAAGCYCIGTNQVDLQAATKHGVPIFNAPYSNTRSVAELVLGEAILLLRGVFQKSMRAHRGVWEKTAKNSYEIRGKNLGIIGYGSIGSQLGVLAEGLGMNVVFYDVQNKLPLGNARQVSTLSELLKTSDVISLHVPENNSTHMMISHDELTQMKAEAVLINAARGTVVDIEALCLALNEGQIMGAAVDVFPIEPKSNDSEFISNLRGFDNVILTPHIGGSTLEAQKNIGLEVSEKLIRYSDNGSTVSSVNLPEVSLPSLKGAHRLLHLHNNSPGVLAAVNNVFSNMGINVVAQYLQTSEDVGYVVIDIESDHSKTAIDLLKSIQGTLKCRVLF